MRRDPLAYSMPLTVVLTACLLFAEHHSALDMHGGVIDRAFISQERSGQVPRQIAYLLLGGIGVWALVRGRCRVRANALVWALGLLLGWAGLSTMWSDTPAITLKRLVVVGLMSVGALGLAAEWTSDEVLRFIAISAAVQVAVGIGAEVVYGFFTPWAGDYRFGGTLHWNQQGYLCLALVLAAFCVRKGEHALVYRWLAGFGLVFLLLTRSRGALIALGIAMLLYFALVLKPVARTVALLVTATLGTMLFATGVAGTIETTLNRGGEGSENLTGRAPLWDELWTYVAHRPWTGFGYEGFWTDATIDDVSGHQHWSIDAAHSGYMEATLTLGYVGAALHTLCLLVAAWAAVRLYRATRDLVFFLAAALALIYLAGGYLESILIVKPSPISFFFALLLACVVLAPRGERVWMRRAAVLHA